MFGHFYNEGMRKMTVAFGQVFNNITIKRTGQIVRYNLLECLLCAKRKIFS